MFKTEGRRGWGLIAVFVAAYVASLGIQAAIAKQVAAWVRRHPAAEIVIE